LGGGGIYRYTPRRYAPDANVAQVAILDTFDPQRKTRVIPWRSVENRKTVAQVRSQYTISLHSAVSNVMERRVTIDKKVFR